MFKISHVRDFKGCCARRFIRNKLDIMCSIIDLYILYYFGLEIYNYSYHTGYNCMDSLLHIDHTLLAEAISNIFKMMSILLSICFWQALSQVILEHFDCKCQKS